LLPIDPGYSLSYSHGQCEQNLGSGSTFQLKNKIAVVIVVAVAAADTTIADY
jgi:hypothetical protein